MRLKTILLFFSLMVISCSTKEAENRVVETSYPDGTPKLVRVCYPDSVSFVEINYFYNGIKERERTLKNGYPHGAWKEWHKNGQLKFDKYYKNGEMDGSQKAWYMDGSIFFESIYDNGSLLNRTVYNHDGSIRSTR